MQDSQARQNHRLAKPPATRLLTTRLLAAALGLAALPGTALAQTTVAPPSHVPGPVSPSSGKAITTPTTSPVPGPSTTGGATGPDGTGPSAANMGVDGKGQQPTQGLNSPASDGSTSH